MSETMLLSARGMYKVRSDRDRQIRMEIQDFTVAEGAVIGVAGPNGCGKSTLLDMLGLLLPPDGVEAFQFAGRDVKALSDAGKAGLRRSAFAYILQRCGMLEFLTIEKNLEFAMRIKGGAAADSTGSAHWRETAARFRLDGLLGKYPAKVSGGQRQRAAIACAVVQNPKVIFADEPTAALDPASASDALAVFQELAHERGITLVVVSHDHALLDKWADAVYHFHVEEQGSTVLSRLSLSGR